MTFCWISTFEFAGVDDRICSFYLSGKQQKITKKMNFANLMRRGWCLEVLLDLNPLSRSPSATLPVFSRRSCVSSQLQCFFFRVSCCLAFKHEFLLNITWLLLSPVSLCLELLFSQDVQHLMAENGLCSFLLRNVTCKSLRWTCSYQRCIRVN